MILMRYDKKGGLACGEAALLVCRRVRPGHRAPDSITER